MVMILLHSVNPSTRAYFVLWAEILPSFGIEAFVSVKSIVRFYCFQTENLHSNQHI